MTKTGNINDEVDEEEDYRSNILNGKKVTAINTKALHEINRLRRSIILGLHVRVI